MGLFGFLKKKEPELTLSLDEVESWLKSYQDSLGLDHHFSMFLSEMRQHVKHTLEQLDILESAQLLNDAVNPRAKQIMEGHRKQFIKRVNDFISSIDIPKEYKSLSSFAESFSEQLEDLNADTQKNVFILKEFFEKESFGVAKNISKMDRSIADLRSTFNRLGKEKVDHAYTKLKEYYDSLERIKDLERALVDEKEKLSEPTHKLEKIAKKIAELESSRGFAFVKDAEKEKEELVSSLAAEKESIRKVVTSLMKPLQKYAHKHPDPLLKKYSKHFADGLLEDEHYEILSLLEKVLKDIEKLDLKPAQISKAKSAAEKVTKKWLITKKKRLQEIMSKSKELQDRLNKDTTRLLLDEQYRWQKMTKEHLDDLSKNVLMIENELERLSPRLFLQKIRDALKEIKPTVHLEMK